MNKLKQKGFIGSRYAEGMVTLFIIAMIVSAIVGWGVIEGFIWIMSHISWV